MELFATAARNKYRFTYRGSLSVEDLWDLNLSQLDEIYRTLSKNKKANSGESLIEETAMNQATADKMEIVKYIFTVKKQEIEEQKTEAQKAVKKQRLLEALAKKQDDSLNAKSEEEILKMIEDLG